MSSRSRTITHGLSPKTRSLLILALGAALAMLAALAFLDLADDIREGDTTRFDEGVLVWLAAHRTPLLTEIFLAVTALGSWPVLTLLTVGTCTALLLAGERRMPLTLAVTMLGAPLLTFLFKSLQGRARPSIVPHLQIVADPSFPSGHTIASVAFFVTVSLLVAAHARRRLLRSFVILYALFIGALVAVSRLYLGVHYPSDVAGGALLGVAWSLAAVIVDRALRGKAP